MMSSGGAAMNSPVSSFNDSSERRSSLIQSLSDFSKQHRAAHWTGSFASFLEAIFPADPHGLARSSHQYVWDMMRSEGFDDTKGRLRCQLFEDELYGINDTIERLVDYFKAASAGSEVGRRLLLLLGPPSGGKSSLVILLKRGLEEYSHTDAGAMYAIHGCPVHESPLHLVPHTLRAQFRNSYGIDIAGELCPRCVSRLGQEFSGDFMQMPVERLFISEAGRVGVGTYAPHDPTTADIADLVGSVDLSKVSEYGDEGDPRAWSWSGAVFAASRGMLEMIEILKVKREFLYLLLTLTQEKNVKVSRFPLIYLDETVVAHTNLAEFRKFLQEAENEALLDRMVIIQVPYTLSYKEEARIYRKLTSSTQAFREVHLDPHALHVAAVFSVLTRLQEGEERDADNVKKVRVYAGEDVEGVPQSEIEKMRARSPDEGLSGVSPRFVINALSNAIIQSHAKSLTTMDVLLALKDGIESDVRIDGKKKRSEKFTLDSHAPLHDAVEQYLFEQRRDVLRLVSSTTRPDDETRQKISVVEKRLVDEYGYDAHSAREALNYVTSLLAQE